MVASEDVCKLDLVCLTGGVDVFKNSGLFEEDWLPPVSLGVAEVSQHPPLAPLAVSGEIRKLYRTTTPLHHHHHHHQYTENQIKFANIYIDHGPFTCSGLRV